MFLIYFYESVRILKNLLELFKISYVQSINFQLYESVIISPDYSTYYKFNQFSTI